MRFAFGEYLIDMDRREIHRDGTEVQIEPQVFDVLVHLIRNARRLVSKDELLDAVWGGRIVSESALTSRINAARRAVGDAGNRQRVIKTIARRGFRFVAELKEIKPLLPAAPANAEARTAPIDAAEAVPELSDTALPPHAPRRGSIAIMPFTNISEPIYTPGGLGDALAHDIITRLAKLRLLFVIAQGTVFALRERGGADVGRLLNVDYVVSGSFRHDGERLTVYVELSEIKTGRVIWADNLVGTHSDVLTIVEDVGARIVNVVLSEVETVERNRAVLRPPNSLDAWEAYHRGLWHMYRFDKSNNETARSLFEAATRLDPTFSRAFAGLSFAHWQKAFQGWGPREAEMDFAYAAAGQSLMVDDRDPAAHWAMGRALWLRGTVDHALTELQHCVDLSPNFAQGYYSMAFVQSQCGDAIAAIDAADRAIALSPYDPMLSAMFSTRALALMRFARYGEAADWCERAIARPNAHPHILAIAYHCFALAERHEEARRVLAILKSKSPSYSFNDFRSAFFLTGELEDLFRKVGTALDGSR